MKGKKLEDMTDEELEAHIVRMRLYHSRTRVVMLCGFVLKVIVLATLICAYGCASKLYSSAPIVSVVHDGVNLDGIREACTVEPQPNGDVVLKACPP